jgi:hypothetical protein
VGWYGPVRYNGAMRNSGWYIPYWRKPKKKGKANRAGAEEIVRSDEELEAVRRRWIERYRRTVHALMLMGLSVGSNRSDVQARYEELRAAGTLPARDLEEAYQHLMRVLAPLERRKRKRVSSNTAARHDAAHASDDEAPAGEDDGDDAEVDELDGELFDGEDEDGADGHAELIPEEAAPESTSTSGGPDSVHSSAADEAADGP